MYVFCRLVEHFDRVTIKIVGICYEEERNTRGFGEISDESV